MLFYKFRKSLISIEKRKAIVLIFSFEESDYVPKDFLFAKTLKNGEMLLSGNHSDIILLFGGSISINTKLLIDGHHFFEFKAPAIALNWLEIRIVQHYIIVIRYNHKLK